MHCCAAVLVVLLSVVTVLSIGAPVSLDSSRGVSGGVSGWLSCRERWNQLKWSRGRHAGPGSLNRSNINGEKIHTLNKRKILYVHVGKTGGEFINQFFRYNYPELHLQQLHIHALDRMMVKQYSTIIISLRNPVDRLISAYYFSHPLIEGSYAYDGKIENSFYKCCPDLISFGNTLFENSKCGNIARNQSLQSVKGHMDLDSCAYMSGVLNELKAKKEHVYLINTESLQRDVDNLVTYFKWNEFYKPSKAHHNTHNHTLVNKPTEVSSKTREQLQLFLQLSGEIDMYNTLQSEFGRVML